MDDYYKLQCSLPFIIIPLFQMVDMVFELLHNIIKVLSLILGLLNVSPASDHQQLVSSSAISQLIPSSFLQLVQLFH
jgi:hypothetical protein